MAGIYIHIPFCKQRCIYCDFYSTAQRLMIDSYIDCLLLEAGMRDCIKHPKTVYMGGGTPSLLGLDQMRKLINGLNEIYDFSGVVEFTVEVNPDDVNVDYIRGLKELGVNRVSMGIQSFNDNELKAINRRHNATDAVNAVKSIKNAGIENISIDLIYGIPGQTINSWHESIACALRLNVKHISAYNLSYEKGTKLWMLRNRGEVKEIDDSTCIEMYQLLINSLKKAGYIHYEISNFCLLNYHSKHNSSYWDETPFIGLGASAYSYDGVNRSYNPPSLHNYVNSIKSGKLVIETEETQWWERYDEMVMVSLRTIKGLNLSKVFDLYGEKVVNHVMKAAKPHIDCGHILLKDNHLIIAEDAVMMSDTIIRDIMWDN